MNTIRKWLKQLILWALADGAIEVAPKAAELDALAKELKR